MAPNVSSPLLPDWIAHWAATAPERVALLADGHEWTFAALDADVTLTAHRLSSLGLKPGDRLATLLHNSAGAVVLTHAALRLGATLVPLNVRLTDGELAWMITDSPSRLLIAEPRTSGLAERAARAPRAPVVVSLSDALGGGEGDADVEGSANLSLMHDPEHVLAVIYTSGTTGRPKGAMLTVGNFWWSAIGSALNLGVRSDDRWLACLPLFHVGGLSIMVRCAIYGTAAVVHDGFDASAVNSSLDDERITLVSVVAVMLQRMIDDRAERPYPTSLRCVLLGGGPAPLPLLERCARLGVPVVTTYGMTETTSQVVTMLPEDTRHRPGAAGRPLYPNAIRIAEGTREADAGEPGEILVKGPVVMAGYSGDPQASARTLVDGWLRTGDVGFVDDHGYLHVLDRRDDLIITGGENVYPAEVEMALLAHPSVAETGVVGVTDSVWGQRVVAVVRLVDESPVAPPNASELLRAHCRSLLAGYKTPSEIRIVSDALPRTAAGKLQRGILRERMAASVADGDV